MDANSPLPRLPGHWMCQRVPRRLHHEYVEYVGEDEDRFPNQFYIYPDECIVCGACEPECPWQTIFEEPAVPEVLKDDVPLNGPLLSYTTHSK